MNRKERVILFGRGMVYRRKKADLYRKYDVAALLDNAVPIRRDQGEGEEESGTPVLNPSDAARYLKEFHSPDVPVILLSYALGDMYRQMREMGVEQNRIRFGPMLPPYNTFEKMLFENGGEFVFEEEEIFYRNRKWNLYIKTNPSNLEQLTNTLKGTLLYRNSGDILHSLPLMPLDDTYGMNRGTPIDRYYIEYFLESQKEWIRGTVMEIADRRYTERFGGGRVTDSIILHVDKEAPEINQIKGNLATGDGLEEESLDCLICTQTLPFIYNVQAAADYIVKILKRGGTALVTVAGISQIIQYEMIHYGHYWSFTEQSLRRLFAENVDVASVEVMTYGNVKTSAAFLYGISSEELEPAELDFSDANYQLIIAAVVRKK